MFRLSFFFLVFGLLSSVLGQNPLRPVIGADPESPGKLQVSWPTIPCHSYQLEESRLDGAWETVTGFPVHAEGRRLSYSFVPEGDRGFYRVFDLGGPEASVQAFFSVAGKKGTEVDLTLENKIKELLLLAEPGSEVLASVFSWSRETMTDAFLAAADRGVDVRLIIGSDYPAALRAEQSLPKGKVLICRDRQGTPIGCHGGPINHNKFVLFSKLSDGSCNVVVQSSANFTKLQTQHHNNLLVMRNDPGLYNAYHIYWHDLYREVAAPDYYWESADGVTASAYFFPRSQGDGRTGKNDTIVEILDDIAPKPGATIRVAMAFWSNARIGIANRLIELRLSGIDVQVIIEPEGAGDLIAPTLRAGGVTVTEYPFVHSKYMLIDTGKGSNRRRTVLTGSHNYTSPALRSNDEVLLRLDNAAIYDQFLADWNDMRSRKAAVTASTGRSFEPLFYVREEYLEEELPVYLHAGTEFADIYREVAERY